MVAGKWLTSIINCSSTIKFYKLDEKGAKVMRFFNGIPTLLLLLNDLANLSQAEMLVY